jgi:hypothetical protein
MVERWTADTRRVDESEGWQVEIRPYEQRGQRNKADRPEPLHIVAVRFDGATESFAASVTVNGSTVLVTDPILSVVQDKVMAALHPHHGANIVKGDGTISVWEATRYHNDGVLAEGFDVPTYLGYVSAARSARQTRQEWVEARRFVAPAE